MKPSRAVPASPQRCPAAMLTWTVDWARTHETAPDDDASRIRALHYVLLLLRRCSSTWTAGRCAPASLSSVSTGRQQQHPTRSGHPAAMHTSSLPWTSNCLQLLLLTTHSTQQQMASARQAAHPGRLKTDASTAAPHQGGGTTACRCPSCTTQSTATTCCATPCSWQQPMQTTVHPCSSAWHAWRLRAIAAPTGLQQ